MEEEYVIRIRNLHKTYDKPILRGVDLDVKKGETLVIIGESGTGKSQILKHLIGLVKPDEGYIEIFGKDISKLSTKEFLEIKRRMGMVFQHGALFDSMTVGENIAFPLRENFNYTEEEINKIIKETLELVGLEESIKYKMPSELSGGMQKRVAVARTVAMKPDILMYDEPTTGLDPITSDKINDLIIDMKLKLNITSIVVTHDMNSAYKIADRIAFLYQGKIRTIGTPEEIKYSKDLVVQQFIRGVRDIEKLKMKLKEEEMSMQFDLSTLIHAEAEKEEDIKNKVDKLLNDEK